MPKPKNDTNEPRSAYVVPRRWLVTLAILLIAPWVIVLGLSVLPPRGAAAPAPVEDPVARGEPAPSIEPGPWGELLITPIVISPPIEQVPTSWGPIQPVEWRFPQTSRDELEPFFTQAGLDRAHVARLLASTREEPRIAGVVVRPDRDLVWGLDPTVRARIYLQLAQSPLNPRQHDAYRYDGASVDDWLGASQLSKETRQLVAPLVYRAGDFLYFADIDLVREKLQDGDELQRLAKALFRVATMMVELRVAGGAQLDSVAEYWGRGGRRTDILPLLESIAGSGPQQQIDITHLLPPVARLNLYRYPKVSMEDLDQPSLVNCLWTALNFFNPRPDDRLVDLRTATDVLRRDYYYVHNRFQLGDVVVFSDAEGNLFHVAVYLAGDLVFTKNGTSSLSPWVILPLSQLKGYYVQYGENTEIQYYRRKDL
jgi:hypothetical protein